MGQLWKESFKKEIAKETNDFISSISFDSRMYEEDIKGSIAHSTKLGPTGIIEKSETDKITAELADILGEIKTGELKIDIQAEDINTFIQGEITSVFVRGGKRLHTARSRNDQVVFDIPMTLKKETEGLIEKVKGFIGVLFNRLEGHRDTIMPSYTHIQHIQPITFGHHLMAYASILLLDIDRLDDD